MVTHFLSIRSQINRHSPSFFVFFLIYHSSFACTFDTNNYDLLHQMGETHSKPAADQGPVTIQYQPPEDHSLDRDLSPPKDPNSGYGLSSSKGFPDQDQFASTNDSAPDEECGDEEDQVTDSEGRPHNGVLIQGIKTHDLDGKVIPKRIISYLPPRPFIHLMDPTAAARICAQIQKHSWELDSICLQRQTQLAVAMNRLEVNTMVGTASLDKCNQGYEAILFNIQDIDLVLKFSNTLTMKLAKAIISIDSISDSLNEVLSTTPLSTETLNSKEIWPVDKPISSEALKTNLYRLESFEEFQRRRKNQPRKEK